MKTRLTSIRLSQAAYEAAARRGRLSDCIRVGLRILHDRYPDRILLMERERLHRRANSYDQLTDGPRMYTKVRISTVELDWLKLNRINVTAACEFAIFDALKYYRLG